MRRLLVFNDQILFYDGNNYSSQDPFVGFIAEARKYFDRVTLLSRVVRQQGSPHMPLPEFFEVRELPFYKNIPDLYLKFPSFYPALSEIAGSLSGCCDFFWLNFAHPVSAMIMKEPGAAGKAFSLVRGNYMLDAYYKNSGLMKYPAFLSALFAERYYVRLSRKTRAPLFAVGRSLSARYSAMGLDVTTIYPTLVSGKEALDFSSLKRDYDFSGRPVKLLYMGRLSREKGVVNLIDVLGEVVKKKKEVHLTVVGEGDEKERLLERARELDLEDKVTLAGSSFPRSAIYNFFRDNDIFVLPSLTEGFPQVILEALLFGMPIVSTDAGSVRDVLEDGRNSFVVKRGDSRAMAERILAFIENPPLAEKFGSHSRERVSGMTMEAEAGKIFNKIIS
ncbi:MAG: glycosyltransferase family 4 protein [Deltaproteobacteria bacterium]|nr:glycosyltransferase family 4 protein [Deltaproteobacteria bacterium]